MDISIAKRKGYSLHEQSNNGKISLVRIFLWNFYNHLYILLFDIFLLTLN